MPVFEESSFYASSCSSLSLLLVAHQDLIIFLLLADLYLLSEPLRKVTLYISKLRRKVTLSHNKLIHSLSTEKGVGKTKKI